MTEVEQYQMVVNEIEKLAPPIPLINVSNLCDTYPMVQCANGTFGGDVVGLDFSNFNAENWSRINWTALTNLTSFNCRNCSLGDIDVLLPPSIQALDVSFNGLARLPDVFNEAHPLLKFISVSHNPGLTANIPPGIGFLEQLNTLLADNCDLVGGLPFEIGQLTELKRLDLQYNRLNGTIPQFNESSTIFQLLLQNNSLVGPLPNPLPQYLTLLTADGNRLSGVIPVLPRYLQGLYLNSNYFTGAVPSAPEELIYCDLSNTFLNSSTLPYGHACAAADLREVCELGAPCDCQYASGVLVCTYVEQTLNVQEGAVLNGTNAAIGDVNINGITVAADGTLQADGQIYITGTLNINPDPGGNSKAPYVVFMSDGGITGQFDQVLVDGVCKEGALMYTASSVSISLNSLGPCLAVSRVALGGIVAGCILVAILVILGISCYVKKKREAYTVQARSAAKAANLIELESQKEELKNQIRKMEESTASAIM